MVMKDLIPAFLITLICIVYTHNQTLATDQDTSMNALFEMSIEELINTEVSIATKSSQKISQTPSVVSVITAEDIKNMGFCELEEVLQSLPGFEFTQTRLGSKPFGIRGVSDIRQGGRLLVLLDGTPYNGIMYGSSVFYGASFNLDAVKRIEVIRGPGSALYGRNAYSAVVNIITKESSESIEVGVNGGSYNTYDIYGSFGQNKKDLSSYVSFKKHKTDGTDVEFLNGQNEQSTWNLTHDNLYTNINLRYKKLSFNGYLAFVKNGASFGPFMSNSLITQNIGTYNISYHSDISDKVKYNLKFYGRNEYREEDLEFISPNTIFPNPLDSLIRPFSVTNPEGIYANPNFKAFTYGTDFEFNIDFSPKNKLLLGLQADYHGVKNAKVRANYDFHTWQSLFYTQNNDTIYYSKENMEYITAGWIKDRGQNYLNAALYLQNMYYPMDNLGITVGGRFDYDSEIGLVFNPRVGLVYGLTNSINLKLLYGKAYKLPTTNQQYKFVGADIGNENLMHETINSFEVVLNHQSNKVFNQLSFFYNKLNDLIIQDRMPENIIYKSYYNKGENISYGFEFENRVYFSNKVNLFFNYSYAHSRDISANENETMSEHPNISPHKLNSGINYFIFNHVNLNLNFRYRSPITKFKYTDQNGDQQDISKDDVGDYLLINSTIRLLEIIRGLEISTSVYNIFDKEYYYQDNDNSNQPAQPGRHFLISARYKF